MVRPKATSSSKKQQQQKRGGVDFKKIKRKLGRKLPPPKNATNTEIKFKSIVLPEQSIAAERVGLAVSKKGLTLKELLQQTSHHNAKVRREALIGIKDLTVRNPEELKLHRLAIIEKLRERISDEDKLVRESLYLLFKSVIFPDAKEEISGPFISLIMAYIFNAMTHLALDIRLMAFKFFELVVQHYPSSFLLYAEKVLKNYVDILQMNNIYLQDKSKLKATLAGLVCCLFLLPSIERYVSSSPEKNTDARGALHAFEPEVPKEHTEISSVINKLEDLMPVLVNCFQELTPSVLVMPQIDAQSFECMLCVIQSIDLAIKFFIFGNNVRQADLSVPVPSVYNGRHISAWGETKLPVLLKKLLEVFPLSPRHHPTEKDEDKYYVLNIGITEIFLHFYEWIDTPAISMGKFLEFLENALSGQICCNTRSSKQLREKHLVSLVPFIPKLVSRMDTSWKYRLLQAFTTAFQGCKPESPLKLACLSAIKEMLLPSNREGPPLSNDTSEPEILSFQIIWTRELPFLLVQLGDKHPSSSKIVLHLQLRLGQCAPMNSSVTWEYDNMQYPLREFYCTFSDEGGINYGPFVTLPRDCQELAICSLYYFSSWDPFLLKSLASCCMCDKLEPILLFRVLEVLQSSYKAGHLQIADLISFLVTLLAHFKVCPEKVGHEGENLGTSSSFRTFKAITREVTSCLNEMGDGALVLQMLQKIILHQMASNPPLDNMCAILRVLALLDSKPTILSEESTSNLSSILLRYLIETTHYIPGNLHESTDGDRMDMCKHYLLPCVILFDKNNKLVTLILKLMGSSIAESKTVPSDLGAIDASDKSSRISTIASILLFMHKDVKIQRILSSCKVEIRNILLNILPVQSASEVNLHLEERHEIQLAFDQLKTVTDRLHRWNDDDLKNV